GGPGDAGPDGRALGKIVEQRLDRQGPLLARLAYRVDVGPAVAPIVPRVAVVAAHPDRRGVDLLLFGLHQAHDHQALDAGAIEPGLGRLLAQLLFRDDAIRGHAGRPARADLARQRLLGGDADVVVVDDQHGPNLAAGEVHLRRAGRLPGRDELVGG